MARKNLLLIGGILLALNVASWREVFVLCQPQYLQVDFLAVGQGDAEFIETPQGHQILIDGGPNSAVLEKLNQRIPFWDKTIDVVILTHPEKDHMAGILEVLKRYKVDYFVWPGAAKDNAESKILIGLLQAKVLQDKAAANLLGNKNSASAKIISAKAGDKIRAGNVMVNILAPLESAAGKIIKEKESANSTCIVSKIIYGKNSFLFAGDIDAAIEKQLAGRQVELLRSDVLKVAHHGSKYSTSEDFLKAVAPQLAVIEVGKNSYGHPTPQTLQRLEKFGIQIKRTDTDGDVEIVSDGKVIQVK